MSEMPQMGFELGRPITKFAKPYIGQDQTFAAQRLDSQKIVGARFQHCAFANLSFKEAKLQDSQFNDCVFLNCYFRRSELIDCKFVGCRFIECDFPHVAVNSCDFRYSCFRGCLVPFAEMEYSLPSEPNLREDLARNLAIESSKLGHSAEARKYRMAEIRAREENLLAAIFGKTKWYRDHFDGLARMRALSMWTLSLLNRWLWGYGEKAWVLLRNLALTTFLIFPTGFYLARDQLQHQSGSPVTVWDTLAFSLQNIAPAGVSSGIKTIGPWATGLASLEALLGVVALGLLASYVFRWSLYR